MHIRPTLSSPISTPNTAKEKGADFAGTLQARTLASQKISTPDPELASLAADLKSGKISKEQACEKFVALVGPNSKVIQSAVTEILSDDPHFISQLETQLKKLS